MRSFWQIVLRVWQIWAFRRSLPLLCVFSAWFSCTTIIICSPISTSHEECDAWSTVFLPISVSVTSQKCIICDCRFDHARVALECLVDGIRLDVLVVADTGAARLVFPNATVPSSTTLQSSSTRLRAASGHALENAGSFKFIGAFGEGPRAKLNTIVSPDLHGPNK